LSFDHTRWRFRSPRGASQRIVAGPNGGFCIAFCPRLSGWRAFFKRGPTVSKRKVRYRLDRLSIQILPAVGPVPRPAAPLAPQCPPRRTLQTGPVTLSPRSRRSRRPRRRVPDSESLGPSASSPLTGPPPLVFLWFSPPRELRRPPLLCSVSPRAHELSAAGELSTSLMETLAGHVVDMVM
jgi:hypothetical protein